MIIHKTAILLQHSLQFYILLHRTAPNNSKVSIVLNITAKYHPGLAHEPPAAHLAEVVPAPGPALVLLVVRVAAAPLVGAGQHEAVHVPHEPPVVRDDPGELVRGGQPLLGVLLAEPVVEEEVGRVPAVLTRPRHELVPAHPLRHRAVVQDPPLGLRRSEKNENVTPANIKRPTSPILLTNGNVLT